MDRDELHELITTLKEEFEAGRIKVNSADTIKDMTRVRIAPDGKVAPVTVTSSVRALALAVVARKHEQEIRKIPLREVHEEYFDVLEKLLGPLFEEMKRHGVDAHALAELVAKNDKALTAFTSGLEEFSSGISEFWDYYGPVVEAHLKDMRSLKVVFGGDVFPSHTANIASSVGLYTDTIVLPDPLHKLTTLRHTAAPRQLFQLSVKHALNALGYKEAALADPDPPIIVIAPDYLAERHYRDRLVVAAGADMLEHFSRIFGRDFSSIEELHTFLQQFPDAKSLIAAMIDPARALFDVDWSDPLPEQFRHWETESGSRLGHNPPAPFVLEQMILGRMMSANDAVLRSTLYGGTPIIDAPTAWQYLLWKYEYNGNITPAHGRDLLITKALSKEGREHGMLSGLPMDALIQLRREGAMSELRKTLQTGIEQIDSASDTMLEQVAQHVIGNIDAAFSEHDSLLKELSSSKKKFYGWDVSRYVVGGSISVAASFVHSAPLGYLLSALPLVGAPSPMDLWKQYKELNAKSDQLRRSPAGVMFRHLKGRFGF